MRSGGQRYAEGATETKYLFLTCLRIKSTTYQPLITGNLTNIFTVKFDKYQNLGAYHWDEYERPTIYREHANYCKEWVKETDCLDIGAGDGLITSLIGCEGIDSNELAVEMAKDKGVAVEVGDAYNLPDKQYKAVFMGDVIEHLEHPEDAIKEVARVLKPGGKFYVATPPKKGDEVQDPYHYREYTPEELREFIEQFGFEYEEHTINNVRIYMSFTYERV